MFHIVCGNDVTHEYDGALFPLQWAIFQYKILKNGKNTYRLSFHPDHAHEKKTFVG